MKKRILAMLLVLCMIVALFPVTGALAATAKYYTVEKYDADGNGTMLVPPTETTNYSGRYGTSFITSVLGSGNVTMENDAVTGIKAADGTWLNNDGSSKWYIATDHNKEVYLDSSYFYASDTTVLRFIYVPNGDFSKAGMEEDGSWADAAMLVEKGDLIKTLAAYDGAVLGGNRKAAFDAGIATVLNINATAEEVAAAKTNMETATDSATGVELNKESTALYVGQKEALTATLTPGGSTDNLTWTSSDNSVVTVTDGVLKGMKAGTATVTVTAENPDVKDTIDVTVNGLHGFYITNMGRNNVIAAETQTLTLMAEVVPENIENLDWQWSVEDPTIAEVTPMEGNEYIAEVRGKKEGTTNVIVNLGSAEASFEVEVTPYDGPYVYFEYADGRDPQLLDDNNTITLTCLDEGKFVVGNGNGTAVWSGGNAMVGSIAGGDDLQYWVFVGSETGKWNPWDVRDLNMTVDCGGWSKSFTVKCAASGITELKTYVGEQEVTVDAPYESDGTVSGVPVTVKGKNADDEWVYIPTQALHYDTGDTTYNFRWTGNQFSMKTGGQATMSVFMKDNWSVKQQFIAKCNYVKLTGFTITTPETFTITGDINFMNGYYYGLELYSDNLKITYEPTNATNKELEWEALTPGIAFFTAQHNAGIVPLRCGTAMFRVTSKDDPSLTQEITVTFLYKKPLVSATLDKTAYELEVGATETLNITVSPEDATEKGFTYSYSEDGIAEVKDGKIIAKSAGQITVTATPLDTTQGCPAITFTVKVTGDAEDQNDPMPLVTDGIAHGLSYLANQSVNKYGNEWSIFTILRAGGSISADDKAAYLESVTAAVQSGLSQPTDYARVILTLGVMGEDPTDFGGVNLIEQLYSFEGFDRMASNMISWTLLALDSKNYEIPEDAVNTRAKLIERLLTFQTESGGFCLSGTATDVDMTGMILQALAPYNNEEYPAVQEAFTKAVTWLKAQMGLTAGFAANSNYNENSCTTAQVLIALSAAGIDAVDPDNGFTIGKNNMVTNLYGYKAASGFYWDPTVETSGSLMGTQQTTYALEAYRRFAAGENALYDLTDVAAKDNTDYKEKLETLVAQAEALNESEYTDDSWSAMAQKLQIARTLLMSGSTDQEQLKEAAENLQNAMDALVKKADLAAANAFIDKVDALPSADEITEDYKETVEALLEEYEGFSKAVKNLIPAACITKLNACNDKIAELKPINVTISVLGDENHDSESDGNVHTLTNGGLTTWIAPTEYSVRSNATVKDVLEKALTANNMTWVNTNGNYVSSINGLAEFDNGINSGWMYTLNGIHPNLSVDVQPLKDGDVIIFHYTDDYTKESDKAADIKVNVTISNAGDVVMAQQEITVTDRNSDRKFDVDEVLYAAHEAGYTGGANAGYASEVGNYGLSITKLWGDESGAFGYWLNNASCMSLTDEVKAGDYVVAYVYQDKNTWTDAYAKFDKQTYTANGELTVTLEKAGYDESWNTVFSKLPGATITAYDAEGNALDAGTYTVKDNGNGTYTITFTKSGAYTLIAAENTTPIVPAVSKATVTVSAKTDTENIYKTTGDYIEGLGTPNVGSTGGEWMVIGLKRSGRNVPEDYYDNVVKYVNENINDKEQLHKNKSTENSRLILALTALGYDVTDVDGHNLLAGLTDLAYLKRQGINGPIWALIALDSHDYEIPESSTLTRDAIIAEILGRQIADGGWALSGTKADPDMTGMAIQALAPYYASNADVKAAVDKAVTCLSELQNDDGGYSSWGTANSESIAQVIVALTAIGIDPATDTRFVKNGNSAIDAFAGFYVEGGGFKHIANGTLNGMATEQGYYALVSYFRFKEGKTSLYDMTDVAINTKAEEYTILDGADGTVKSGESYSIRASGDISKFVRLLMDGKTVDSANYTLKEGSTIVTFKPEYLKTLDAGKHQVTFVYTDGEVTTSLTVEASGTTEDPGTKPEDPGTKPEDPGTKPEDPETKPTDPETKPETKPTETKPNNTPSTGDESGVVMYAVVMAVTLMCIAVLMIVYIKNRKQGNFGK